MPRRTRNGSDCHTHQQHGDRQHHRQSDLPGETRNDGHEEGERGEVDDHDIDERRGHHQDGVLELRQRDQDDDQRQRQRRRRHRPPQQDQPEEIEQAPGEHERHPRCQIILGPDQQAGRCEVKRGKERDGAQTPAIGGHEAVLQVEDSRRHDGCQGSRPGDIPGAEIVIFL